MLIIFPCSRMQQVDMPMCFYAYHKFGDPRYLEHCKSALEALISQKESRFYEALLPLGVYVAAYLNASRDKIIMYLNSLIGCLMAVKVLLDVLAGNYSRKVGEIMM